MKKSLINRLERCSPSKADSSSASRSNFAGFRHTNCKSSLFTLLLDHTAISLVSDRYGFEPSTLNASFTRMSLQNKRTVFIQRKAMFSNLQLAILRNAWNRWRSALRWHLLVIRWTKTDILHLKSKFRVDSEFPTWTLKSNDLSSHFSDTGTNTECYIARIIKYDASKNHR
jgi:hypothetical protein